MAEKGLASRFKAALTKEATKGTQKEAAAAQEEARRARFVAGETRVFDDLTALVGEIGGIEATRGDGELLLSRGRRKLSFHRDAALERLDVKFDRKGAPAAALVSIDEAWHLETAAGRVALFDAGLEDLLVRGLGLPPPVEPVEPEASKAEVKAAKSEPAPAQPASTAQATEPVVLKGVKVDKAAPVEKKKPADRDLGSPGSTVKELPKW